MLCCAVLYCTALCCAALHCVLMCCAVLYCTALCCAVLCCAVLCCVVPKALLPEGNGRDVYPRVQVNGRGCVCRVRAVCKCVDPGGERGSREELVVTPWRPSLLLTPYCVLLCCVVLCCAVLCCAVLCCAVLCSALLCCDMMYCAVRCCAVRCFPVLCSDVLCCAVRCCDVLHCGVLRCVVLHCTARSRIDMVACHRDAAIVVASYHYWGSTLLSDHHVPLLFTIPHPVARLDKPSPHTVSRTPEYHLGPVALSPMDTADFRASVL